VITSPTQKSDTARDSTNQLQVTWRLFLVVIKKITNPLPKTVTREIIIRKDQYQVICGSREKCFCKGWLPISVVLFIALEFAINGRMQATFTLRSFPTNSSSFVPFPF